jgi:23S rRNA pseudouridine1911/1915/1917 synthase
MAELRVPPRAAGRRLDAWLAEAAGSRAGAQRLIDDGRVLVDGRPRPKSFQLSGGETVSAELEQRPPSAAADSPEPAIVLEDDWLLVVDKPPGLVVHPAPGHRRRTLVEQLEQRAGGRWAPHVVHRLDRDTSGLMLVAKSEQAQRRLREALRRRDVEREYLALVEGRPASRSGTIEAPIGRDERRRTRMSTRTAKPREARTHFSVERELPGLTLVRARLETGRTHQIRAHFAAIGHPLAGDRDYGGRPLPGLRRQFLHSARLRFPHPEDGRWLELSSPLPGDIARVLEALKGLDDA